MTVTDEDDDQYNTLEYGGVDDIDDQYGDNYDVGSKHWHQHSNTTSNMNDVRGGVSKH